MHTLRYLVSGLMAAGILAPPARQKAAPPTKAAPPPGAPAEERGLAARVTMSRSGIYLGELLEVVSRNAGIDLKVDVGNGPVDGIQLAVFVDRQPVKELLNRICALLSSPYDRWEWQPEPGKPGAYRLRHQRAPKDAAELMRQAMQERWTADLKELHAIAREPRDQRPARIRARPDLFPGGTADHEQLDLLASVDPADLPRLVGSAEIPIQEGKLTVAAQAALRRGVLAENTRKSVPAFQVSWTEEHAGPVLWFRNRDYTSFSILGGIGWDGAWVRSLNEGWHHQTDPEVMNFLTRRAARDPKLGAAGPTLDTLHWLRLIHQNQRLNLLADRVYPRNENGGADTWLGSTPEQTMAAFTLRGMMWKKAGATYLLRDKVAGANPRLHLISWPERRQLRRAVERNQGFLGLPDLLALSRHTAPQILGLMDEFPDLDPERLQQWTPILQFFGELTPEQQKRLTSQTGLPLREVDATAQRHLTEGPDPGGVRGAALLARDVQRAEVSLRWVDGTTEVVTGGVPLIRPVRRLVWETWVSGSESHLQGWTFRHRNALEDEPPLLP